MESRRRGLRGDDRIGPAGGRTGGAQEGAGEAREGVARREWYVPTGSIQVGRTYTNPRVVLD